MNIQLIVFTFSATIVSLTAALPVISQKKIRLVTNEKSYPVKYDLETTIAQVQKILERDPTLPRLTRGEIEDLFDQVSKDEFLKTLNGGDLSRAQYMRSLMLVMPYNTDNRTEQNLQELYTRPPITKVVENYSLPTPQKYPITTFSLNTRSEVLKMENVDPTTYKPSLLKRKPLRPLMSITTYHPKNLTTYHPSKNFQFIATTSTTAKSITIPNLEDKTNNVENVKSFSTRYSSHYNAKKPTYKNRFEKLRETERVTKPVSPELADVLQSLGFATDSQSKSHFLLEEEIAADEAQHKPVISSLIKQRATAAIIAPRTNIAVEDFTRSMMAPKQIPDAYITFRPLKFNEKDTINPEMEDYLRQFGLVPTSNWKSLQTSSTTTPAPKIASSKRFARNFRPRRTTKAPSINKRIDENFDDNDYNEESTHTLQFKKLLQNIGELESLNIRWTPEMFKKVKVVNTQQAGPDPNKVKEFVADIKNEIKRQSPKDSAEPTRFNLDLSLDGDHQVRDKSTSLRATSDTDTDFSSTTLTDEIISVNDTSSPTSTEESRNGSLNDLEDSFGGPDPVTENPLPPPKKNGFYFLADWNSFLEVGEGEEQVVVRLSKKIGDGRRFIPVKIP